MTIRAWLSAREPSPPSVLSDRLLDALGGHAGAPASRATDIFMATSRRILRELLERERFARDGALDLLAADALMTYAFEHASEDAADARALSSLAAHAATDIARLTGTNG